MLIAGNAHYVIVLEDCGVNLFFSIFNFSRVRWG